MARVFTKVNRYKLFNFVLKYNYYLSKMLCILPFRIDFKNLKASKSKRIRIISIIVRSLIMLAIGFKSSRTFEKIFETNENDKVLTYIGMSCAVLMQIFSFRVIFEQIFRTQVHIDLFNNFFKNIRDVVKLTKGKAIYQKSIVLLFTVKMITTNSELLLDLPLLREYVEKNNYGEIVIWIFGWYLWMGTVVLLNVCSIGFVVIAALIETLTNYLNSMIRDLERLSEQESSNYQKMNRLMYYSDKLEETVKIYSDLYATAHKFNEAMKQQILFALIYYISGAVIILHITYTTYLSKEIIHWSQVIIGINRLIDSFALIISVDLVIRKADVPAKLNLDILWSDLDERWDKCVDSYYGTMKLLEMKFKLRGLFEMNAEFILIILSGFMSYFAVLVTFRLSGIY